MSGRQARRVPAVAALFRRALWLALGVALASCNSDQTLVAPEFTWSRMLDQPRYDPFEESAYFEDGRTMRTPPEGTVPRGRPYVTRPDIRRGADAAGNFLAAVPVPVTRALLERGRERFNVFCAACHGVLGDGVTPVALNMQLRRPPSLHEPEARGFPPGRIFAYASFGFGMMPAYAAYLSVDERWAIAAYVKALQLSQYAPAGSLPPALRAELAREAP